MATDCAVEMGLFELVAGSHVERVPGTRDVRHFQVGDRIPSCHNLSELWPDKFRQVVNTIPVVVPVVDRFSSENTLEDVASDVLTDKVKDKKVAKDPMAKYGKDVTATIGEPALSVGVIVYRDNNNQAYVFDGSTQELISNTAFPNKAALLKFLKTLKKV